jgi:crotonobetainyl-CoA:carnitine CoA-transferase CaiB-like acyl-CoA transferase
MAKWPRVHAYRTRDDRVVIIQTLADKFWQRLCAAVDRPDLICHYEAAIDPEAADEEAFALLTELFATRTRSEWMAIFLEHDIPGAPVNTVAELVEDPHFVGRPNTYQVTPSAGPVFQLTGTPICVDDAPFAPALAPSLGADTDDVLREFGGYGDEEIVRLRQIGVIT